MARRPKTWTLLLLAALPLAGVVGWWARASNRQEQRVHARWEGGTLLVSAEQGYPYVVTHLEGITKRGEVCVTRLPEPLVFIDSETLPVPAATLMSLGWVDSHGHRVSPPPPGSPVTALYYRPEEGR